MNSGKTAAAFGVATFGIACFAAMDAVMKDLSLAMGAYNTLLWRSLAGVLIAGMFFFGLRCPRPKADALRLHIIRGLLGIVIAFLFFWGLVRVPLAQGVALSFIAPLIALYLAAIHLREQIEKQAIFASILGFAGVIVILSSQAEARMGPEAFEGALAILAAAVGYAYNIILMRRQALVAKPLEIAFFNNLTMATGFVIVAPFFAFVPSPELLPGIVGAAGLAFMSLLLLSWAYARAEAQYLAPVEYTAFVWASIFGLIFFGEEVRPLTIAGASMIVVACLVATRRRPVPMAEAEAAI